jgi:hypothetical protein
MARSRPGALAITYGVITIVTGCLFLGCGVCGAAGAMATVKMEVNGKDVMAEYNSYMSQNVPAFTVIQILDIGLRLVLALGFIAAGVGLFFVPKWGQVAALLFSLLGIFHQFIRVLWQVVWIGPAKTKFGEIYPILNLHIVSGAETAFTIGWAIFFLLLYLGILIGLSLPFAWRKFWGSAQQDLGLPEDESEPRHRGSRSEAFEADDDRIR